VSGKQTQARTKLDAWREQGADRMDRVRFHRIDALERRAAGHDGDVRRLLDDRLSGLIREYAADLESVAANDVAAASGESTRGAIGGLIDYLAQQSAVRDRELAVDASASRPAFPQLGALDEFRAIWTKLRAEAQLRQSLQQASTDAGPLNSGRLVHRSLTLMRELSPGYLQQFLAYVDALNWVEQMSGDGVTQLDDALRTGGSGSKRGRDKPRRRGSKEGV
jgi:hypothetical protein